MGFKDADLYVERFGNFFSLHLSEQFFCPSPHIKANIRGISQSGGDGIVSNRFCITMNVLETNQMGGIASFF